jgi:hypothetical protein
MNQIENAMNLATTMNNSNEKVIRTDPNKHYMCPYPACSYNTEKQCTPNNRVNAINNHIVRRHLTRVGTLYHINENGKYVCNRCNEVFAQKDGSHIARHLKNDGLLPEPICYLTERQEQRETVNNDIIQEIDERVEPQIQEQREQRDTVHELIQRIQQEVDELLEQQIQQEEDEQVQQQTQEQREIQRVNNREQDLLRIIYEQAKTVQMLTELLNQRGV